MLHALPPPRVLEDVGGLGHRLDPSDQDHLHPPGLDLLGRVDRRLHARGALPLDRGPGNVPGDPRLEEGDPRDVDVVGPHEAVPEEHVVEVPRIDPGLCEAGLHRVHRQIRPHHVLEHPAEAPDRSPDRCDDEHVLHAVTSI